MSFMATFVVSIDAAIGIYVALFILDCASGAVLLGAAAAFCVIMVRSSEIFENIHHDHACQAKRYECDDQ